MSDTVAQIDAAFAPKKGKSATVTLHNPIKRVSGADVDVLILRKPAGGELRGLRIPDIVNGDTDTILTLLPRIATPHITEAEAETLEFDDITQVTGAVLSFLETLTKKSPTTTH